MQQASGWGTKPLPKLATPGRQPEIVLMQNANSIGPSLLDAEIGLCRPRLQIGTALRSDEQRVGKAVGDLEARVTRASVDDNYLNSLVLLIHYRFGRGGGPKNG